MINMLTTQPPPRPSLTDLYTPVYLVYLVLILFQSSAPFLRSSSTARRASFRTTTTSAAARCRATTSGSPSRRTSQCPCSCSSAFASSSSRARGSSSTGSAKRRRIEWEQKLQTFQPRGRYLSVIPQTSIVKTTQANCWHLLPANSCSKRGIAHGGGGSVLVGFPPLDGYVAVCLVLTIDVYGNTIKCKNVFFGTGSRLVKHSLRCKKQNISRITLIFFNNKFIYFCYSITFINNKKITNNRTQKQLKQLTRAVVVAQLAEWSLPIPEVRGSNPVIGKNY